MCGLKTARRLNRLLKNSWLRFDGEMQGPTNGLCAFGEARVVVFDPQKLPLPGWKIGFSAACKADPTAVRPIQRSLTVGRKPL